MEHSRFALNSFFFKANDNIGIENGLVNPKNTKKYFFFRDIFALIFLCSEQYRGMPVFVGR